MGFSHAKIATAATSPSPIFGHKFTNGVGNYGSNNQYYFVDPALKNHEHNYFHLNHEP